MSESAIRNILFDLGVVLVHLDYNAALDQMLPFCNASKARSGQAVFSLMQRDPVLARYERGEASLEDVFEKFCRLTGFRASLAEFVRIWNGIFTANEPMIDFGRYLAESLDVYILTNAGSLHVPYLFDRFPSLRFYRAYAASCDLGVLKPDARFYRKALKAFGVDARTCLFIDDLQENVNGAEAIGIRSVRYAGPERTMNDVLRMLDMPYPDRMGGSISMIGE